MKTQELLEELFTKPKCEIESALLVLLLKDKFNFVDLCSIYTQALKMLKEDQENLLIEAETCILQQYLGGSDEDEREHNLRCLYLLDYLKHFNINDLKKKFNYDEERAKELSWYYQQKQM